MCENMLYGQSLCQLLSLAMILKLLKKIKFIILLKETLSVFKNTANSPFL